MLCGEPRLLSGEESKITVLLSCLTPILVIWQRIAGVNASVLKQKKYEMSEMSATVYSNEKYVFAIYCCDECGGYEIEYSPIEISAYTDIDDFYDFIRRYDKEKKVVSQVYLDLGQTVPWTDIASPREITAPQLADHINRFYDIDLDFAQLKKAWWVQNEVVR
jgi:hypothetical protein